MSESIAFTGRHHDVPGRNARQKLGAAAAVGAVMGRDEHVGARIRSRCEHRPFSGRLEISRQEQRGAVIGRGA
jgi:hypothetical protein